MHLTAFLDEIDTFYKSEFAFLKEKTLHLESPKAVVQLAQALKIARFEDLKMLDELQTVYMVLTSFD